MGWTTIVQLKLNHVYVKEKISNGKFKVEIYLLPPLRKISLCCLYCWLWTEVCLLSTPWTQDVNWTYIRCSKDVLDFFRTLYVRSIYVLRPEDKCCCYCYIVTGDEGLKEVLVTLCAIWYHLYNFKKWKTLMEECYF